MAHNTENWAISSGKGHTPQVYTRRTGKAKLSAARTVRVPQSFERDCRWRRAPRRRPPVPFHSARPTSAAARLARLGCCCRRPLGAPRVGGLLARLGRVARRVGGLVCVLGRPPVGTPRPPAKTLTMPHSTKVRVFRHEALAIRPSGESGWPTCDGISLRISPQSKVRVAGYPRRVRARACVYADLRVVLLAVSPAASCFNPRRCSFRV